MTRRAVKIEAVDLYCGAGGLTCGLQQADINVIAGIDLDGDCKFAFEDNNASAFLERDVEDLSGQELNKLFSENAIKLLAGCAPCQPFSTYTNGTAAHTHAKWGLLQEFERLIFELEPDLVTMENVPQLADHQPFEDFVSTLKHLGYQYDWQIVNCADYGVPQHRKRLVLLASRLGPIKVPPKTHEASWVSAKQAIAKLPKLAAGEQSSKDPLHKACTLSPLNMKRMKASFPGGTWSDWPKELVAKCHQVEKGRTFRGVYGRMRWDTPAPTMTTLCFGFGNGRFGHPEQHRAISLREAAIIQSFPPTYRFTEKKEEINFKGVGRMIGNAVPPALGAAIGLAIVKHVKAHAKQSR